MSFLNGVIMSSKEAFPEMVTERRRLLEESGDASYGGLGVCFKEVDACGKIHERIVFGLPRHECERIVKSHIKYGREAWIIDIYLNKIGFDS